MESKFSTFSFPRINPEDVGPAFQISWEEDQAQLKRQIRKYWDVGEHCSELLFPEAYPNLQLSNPSSNYQYLRYISGSRPDQELAQLMTQAHRRVLARLNHFRLQVRNFVLPEQLGKMKHIDPYSRQKTVEEMAKYLGNQNQLRNVVLEQAEITFADFCRLLLSLAQGSRVRRLYLWNVLDSCQVPFKGPLQSDTIIDDCPRIPYTYNPGGRKYLRKLEESKHHNTINAEFTDNNHFSLTNNKEVETKNIKITSSSSKKSIDERKCEGSKNTSHISFKKTTRNSESEYVDWMELLLKLHDLHDITKLPESYQQLFRSFPSSNTCVVDRPYPVIVETQCNVGVQCDITQEASDTLSISKSFPNSAADSLKTLKSTYLSMLKIELCKRYLKINENREIKIEILRDIYTIALGGLTDLTTLSINYGLLADGTGNALLTIGSVSLGRLRDLELLCQQKDLPFPAHAQYDKDALHSVPDLSWRRVRQLCPRLRVHVFCESMSPYDISKQFITKSIPLCSFHIDNGFCPTLVKPQITFSCTLKNLYLDFKNTLEHISIVLWHISGRIDSALEKFIKEANRLRSFEYCGPLQYKSTICKLCEAALDASLNISNFKLMVEADPCYPHRALELTADLYKQFLPKFSERHIQFTLGTHGTCKKCAKQN